MQENSGQIVERILSESGKTQGEVDGLIQAKKDKFSGRLTEDGAAFMGAKELGIELGEQRYVQKLSISELQNEMQNVDLLVKVMHVFSPKQFEKNGKRGKLCSLIVADSTGETRLTLWHNDVKKLQESGIERGSVLMLHNCYVKSFNEKPQLNLSYNGGMRVNPQNVDKSNLPKVEEKEYKLSELRADMNEASAIVRILRLFQ